MTDEDEHPEAETDESRENEATAAAGPNGSAPDVRKAPPTEAIIIKSSD